MLLSIVEITNSLFTVGGLSAISANVLALATAGGGAVSARPQMPLSLRDEGT